ncbi:hypothetical protein CALCODRAFT_502374 [Calocera cornea HHB12733]|uniref:Pericentrin/AKAP-450 centrosomal targeting domain-containing protein n=1 Tax=Calocera cornea HHB12733 TaxID=1353952 RepID=A0A165DA08_9BASI|nr:hypothetical protein CALCODRAFT_502374 [Calocera cornea HHB12733]
MATLETPARIMRRIEEASLVEMPSLPSFPMNESDDGPGDPMYPSAAVSESEEHERSITSFPTDPTESEEPATRVTSTPLVTSAFRNSGSRFISGGSRHTSGSQSRFINSLHTTLLPNGMRRETSFRASPIESSVASTVKAGERKSSYGSTKEVESGRGMVEVAEQSNFSLGTPIDEEVVDESVEQKDEHFEESVKSDELHEAQESFVSAAAPILAEYEEYQVSVHSAPMPSPKDPMKNISMRRRSSPHVVKRAAPVLSDSSFSSISEEEQPKPSRGMAKIPELAELSHDITLPQDTPRSVRDTSHMKRAFSSSPAAAAEESDHPKSASITKLPPLSVSPMDSHFTTIASIPQTPVIAGSNAATNRRASYVLSVLSSTRPHIKATPHPYRAPVRRTPHPLIRASLDRRASFATATTSTPSTNNDLTTNLKANTSFDPAIGETRFNVAKMNGYLHKLNEKLVEENLGLHLALKEVEGSSSSNHSTTPSMRQPSIQNSSLPEESVAQAEEWHYVIASLREELDISNVDRERLEDEVKGLTLNAARKEMEWEAKLRGLERDLEQARAESVRWEDKAKQESNDRVASQRKHEQDIRLAEEGIDAIVKELEGRIQTRDREIQTLKEKVADVASTETEQIKTLQERLEAERIERDAERQEAAEQQRELQMKADDLKRAMTSSDTLANQASSEVDRLSNALGRLRSLQPRLDEAEAKVVDQRILLANKEAELDEMRATISDLSEELSACHDTIQELEASLKDKEEELELVQRLQPETRSHMDATSAVVSSDEHEEQVAALQDELDEAHRELGKLRHQLSGSPTKDAVVGAMKVETDNLKLENAQLKEALGLLSAVDKMQTPARKNTTADLTPSAVHRSIQALKLVATPGSPLKELSWMQNSTFSAAHVAPLLMEIQRLRDEVAVKEQKVDDELDGLQDAFGRNNEILSRLQDEIDRRQQLQIQVNEFTHRERILDKRLARLKCVKCKKRFDASDVLHIDVGEADQSIEQLELSLNADMTHGSEVQHAAIAQLNDELNALKADMSTERRQWKQNQTQTQEERREERRRTQKSLETLEAERARTRMELKDIQDAKDRQHAALNADLQDARSTINQLRSEIRAERAELQSLTEEQARMQREKTGISHLLDQRQSELEGIRNSLREAKRTNAELQAALQATGASERQNRVNMDKLRENGEAIRKLREERERLLNNQSTLQQELGDAQDYLQQLQQEREEREALAERYKVELDNMAEELQSATQERQRLHEDRIEVQRMIRDLERDLHRLRKEADRFGHDLSDLQAEKDRVEAKRTEEKAQSDRQRQRSVTEVRLMKEQLNAAQAEARRWEATLAEHVCAADSEEIEQLRIQHKKECKGLIVQIHYLKDMYKRETVFRMDLSYQKRYLLGVLARTANQPITKVPALIAGGHRIERPITLRGAVQAVIFLTRMQ